MESPLPENLIFLTIFSRRFSDLFNWSQLTQWTIKTQFNEGRISHPQLQLHYQFKTHVTVWAKRKWIKRLRLRHVGWNKTSRSSRYQVNWIIFMLLYLIKIVQFRYANLCTHKNNAWSLYVRSHRLAQSSLLLHSHPWTIEHIYMNVNDIWKLFAFLCLKKHIVDFIAHDSRILATNIVLRLQIKKERNLFWFRA